MISVERIRVYEQDEVVEQVGETIRPGGLELTQRALDLCALPGGARLLDVGCGPAASVRWLIERRHLAAVGLDLSARLLRQAQRPGALPLIQAAGESLPVGDGRFDAVLAECSLSAMSDASRALSEFRRVLRPGGWLILSDVYARNPDGVEALKRLPVDSCLAGAVPQAEVIECVQARGFALRLWEDHTDALKLFAARLIWANGSMLQFWCRAASCASAADIQAAIEASRPGYYLLVAQAVDGG